MNVFVFLKKIRRSYKWFNRHFSKEDIGYLGPNTIIEYPIHIESPKDVHVYENARVRNNLHIINAPGEKVIIKKYSVIAGNVTICTNSHRSTVGIPHFLLGSSHINDKSANVMIEEDVWVGTNATIMAGVTLGRGCIVAAGAIVTKSVPPYALVAGAPAKIIAKIFFLEDILQHEEILYPEGERLTRNYLQKLFDEYYQDKKVYGINKKLSNDEKILLKKNKSQMKFVDLKNHEEQ